MRFAVLLSTAALLGGSVFAAQTSSGTADRDSTVTPQHSTAASSDTQHKEGFVDRAKRALRNMGEKLGNATHSNTDKVARSDTSTMGAAGSATQDSDRQHRMDQAYNDWKSQQQQK